MEAQSTYRRTQIYLSAEHQAALAAIARAQRSTSSALIRQAVDDWLATHQPASRVARRMAAAGKWQPNEAAPDLQALRAEERRF